MATIRTSIQIQDGLSQAFRAMNVAMQTTINSFEHLQQASGNAVDISSIEMARRELARAESAFNDIETQISQANQQQNRFNNSIREGTTAANAMLSKLLAIVGTYISIQAATDLVRGTVSLSDELTNTTARLNLMNDGLQTTEQLQRMIFESAQRSYGAYDKTADLVGKLGTNARDAFSNTKEIVAFAELLNKEFSNAGTNVESVNSAILQMTQALGSGVLQGEEYKAILEASPTIMHNIADYLEVPIGALKKMASEGQITAEVVKQSMFAASEDINKKFNDMPLTFSQIWQNIKNEALWAFQDVLKGINNTFNSDRFLSFVESAKSALYTIGNATLGIFNTLASVGAFVYDNWFWLGPIILGVAGALATFVTYLAVVQVATWLVTAAQWAWNAAMMANPIGLVIAGIVLLIGFFYAAIATLNHFAGTSISATGIIAGTFMTLNAFLHNIIAGWWNLFASLVEFWANVWFEPTYTIKRLFANLANAALDMATAMIGNFDSAATNLANMFISGANMAITAINWVIDALNNVPGIDIGKVSEISHRQSITADYSGLKSTINDWVGDTPADYWEAPKMDFKNIGAEWDKGYDWGANLFAGKDNDKDASSSWEDLMSSINMPDLDAIGGVDSPAAKKTAGNTAKMAKSMEGSVNELKYMRDLADREAINRYTTRDIKIDVKNENHINNEMDLDGIIDKFAEKLEEAVDITAEGAEVDV